MTERRAVIISILVALACVAFFYACQAVVGAALFPGPTTDVRKYERRLADWEYSGMTDHFPQQIPETARNPRMSELTARMPSQGADWFQLRLELPLENVLAIEADVKSRAVRVCPSQCTSAVENPEYWHVPGLHAAEEEQDTGPGGFPSGFNIYALYTDGDWNHPDGFGVAVSESRREVVYWAEW